MAKRDEPYVNVIVESYWPQSTAGLHGPIHIRPIEGQPFPTHLHVECNKDLVDPAKYPVGTRFKIRAKLTDRLGTGDFLYSYFGWAYEVLGKPVRFVDQYSAEGAAAGQPEKRIVSGSAYVRDREVRDQALVRAGGCCEYCGEQGFEMVNGNIYLETHHIVPLSEGGKDIVANVAALCANHHRQVHHGKSRVEMRRELLKRISGKAST